jgi:periplasmic protein TonB
MGMDADLVAIAAGCRKAPELSKDAIRLGLSVSVLLHGLLLVVVTSRHSAEARQAKNTAPVVVSLQEDEQPPVPGTQMAGAAGEAQNDAQPAHDLRPNRRKHEQRPAPVAANIPSLFSPEANEASSEKPTLVASTAVAGEEVADANDTPSDGPSGAPGIARHAGDGTGPGCCAPGNQKPAQAISPPLRVPARPVLSPHPTYPRQARLMGWEGTVVLRLLVDAQGNVAEVKMVTGSGFALLDESAVDAARHWRFEPAREGGRPTAMVHEVRFRFRLDNVMG